MRILAGRIADARSVRDHISVRVSEGRISAIEPWTDATRPEAGDVDARNALVMPGFIDIHVHGGAGRNIMEGTDECFSEIARHLGRYGVTGFLATTVTGSWDDQARAISVGAHMMRRESEQSSDAVQGAAVLGCHLEGPYINLDKRGAQPRQFILPPDPGDLLRHVGANLAAIKVVTLAPELPGALDLIRFLAQHRILPSVGHTDATYAEVSAAIDAGARHVTHCYNAMRQLGSREPGVVGAAMARPELSAELIWDNVHVHPASCRALVRAKGAAGVILISDGIPGVGMPDGYGFSLGDLPVVVKDGSARLPDGTLAGSLLTLDVAVRNASDFTLQERARMSSRNAAVALGLGARKGLIAPGFDADLVVLAEASHVLHTFVRGQAVFEST